MSTEYLKIILDLVILIGLGCFMYYALRLSKALNAFRAYRNEFESVIRQLNAHIDNAQKSIEQLKTTSKTSAEDLRKLVKDAQFLADDLQIINESGNNLAARLEGLAEKNRRALPAGTDYEATLKHHDNVRDIARHRKDEDGDFFIQDREFEEDDFSDQNSAYDDDDPALNDLSSDAEKELYRALKKTGGNKKRKA